MPDPRAGLGPPKDFLLNDRPDRRIFLRAKLAFLYRHLKNGKEN